MPDPVLALDLGGTKIRAALVHGAGADDAARPAPPRLDRVAEVPTPATVGPAAILGAAAELAEQVRAGAQVQAVGLSSAGVIDSDRGRVSHATDSLTGWAGTDLLTPLADRFGVPVSALNDVHAHGLGEARFGAGRDRASLLLVAVGTGIGGCHVLDGRAVLGSHGAAGHVGHMPVPEAEGVPCPCGRMGHLEGLASGPGILQLASRLGADPALTGGRALAAAANAGDTAAREAYRIAGLATGRVIGALLNVLDPEVVALTGGVHGAGAPWRDAVNAGIAQEAMDVVAATPVLPASAGEHAALLGAAARALDDLAAPVATLP
ncbi:ROK family protein [Brachybacterium paraconglomeratum]|uniref:ROK family protein n=1 Tax=Brachybacterium paraconglomeratum TaxID=173362 RepID=UPI0031F1A3F3